MMQLNPLAILDVVPADPRRAPRDYVAWQVVRAGDAVPWLPGDRFTLYRVGHTKTFRLEHAPIAVNRLRARYRSTMMPMCTLLRAVVGGDWLELAGSTLTLKALPADGDEQTAEALR